LEVSSTSQKLIEDIAMLLRRFGIVPYIKTRPDKEGTGACAGTTASRSYRLTVSKALELKIFAEKIGFLPARKAEALGAFLSSLERINGYSPKRCRYSVLWEEVVSVEPVESEDPYSYDLSVEGTEKFVSGGVIVHNSESAIRMALKVAEAVSPVVLWLDEIDKGLAGMKGSGELDSGVTSRVVSTILTWRQETKYPVMLTATANDVAAIPAMVYRKGRLDEVWATELPNKAEREEIFQIHLRKRGRDPKLFGCKMLAARTEDFVGAEIEGVIEDAMFLAFDEGKEVTGQHIVKAISETVPQARRNREEIRAISKWVETRARLVSGGEKYVKDSGGAVRKISMKGRSKK